jgi:nucleoside-diphosphate-sugar epimerase
MIDLQKARVAITGATGLLGSVIVRRLVAIGCQDIVALKRPTSRMDLVADVVDQVTWIVGDLLDRDDIDHLVEGCDVVIHAAAMVSFSPRDRQRLLEVNATTTRDVVNACIDLDVKKLVFISSVAAIGRMQSGKVIDESSEWVKSTHNTAYAISKYQSELEVWRGQAESLSTVVLNPSIILGAGYWDSGSAAIVARVAKGMPYYGAGATAVVDVRDVVDAVVLAIDKDVSGQRMIIAGHNVTYQKLFTAIAAALKVTPPRKPLPRWLGAIVARVEVVRSRLFGTAPLITPETVRTSRFTSIYDNSKSIELLGLTYRPLEQTTADIATVYDQTSDYGLTPMG